MTEDSITKKKAGNGDIRLIHRAIGAIVFLFTLYFAVTGTVIQVVDLHARLTHAPATDPEMVQVHEGLNGPRNFIVIQATDYAATPLPENLDFNTALTTVLSGARRVVGQAAPLKFVELRIVEGKPAGLVSTGAQILRFDAATGASMPAPEAGHSEAQRPSVHLAFHILHTERFIGNWFTFVNVFVGLGLFVTIVAGLVLYFRLLRERSKAGLKGTFWSTGGRWRSLHRGIAVIASLFLLVISGSGTMLAIDAFGLGIYQVTHRNAGKYAQFPIGALGDFSSPLSDVQLPAMLRTTLSAGRRNADSSPIKAVRLRYFNGIPQGILIAGRGEGTVQLVFNAETGNPMSVTEPGYPKTHYYLGWKEHELMKTIHRGDVFGIPSQIMALLAGLSLIYLSISGGVMYVNILRRRRRDGKT